MRFHFVCTALAALALSAVNPAAAQEPDSLQVEKLQETVVSAVRASKDAPFAVANFRRAELQDFSSSGRELPLLFSRTPGIIAWSENGVGTGTTYLRIRGAGGSRINVTLDGVPLNSPEDQTVFWANMNSYGKLLSSVQIQRGVGTSTNGDGAFGGTIALGTKAPSLVPTGEITASYGSFNTLNVGGDLSTGLLWNHLVMDGAYHQTTTDGFLPGTSGRSGSYYGGVTWLGSGWKLSYKLIGNFENTGQAWNGVTAGNDDLSLMDGTYGEKTGIRTYADLWKAGLGTYNSLYERLLIDGSHYTLERYRMDDGSYWPRTTDNFWQNHHLLGFSWNISDALSFSATAHYTAGHGWYDEFRYNNKLLKYGIPNFVNPAGQTVKRSDFVRQKGLTQDTWGGVASLHYAKGRWDALAGISIQQFKGNHYGYLTYAGNPDVMQWFKSINTPCFDENGLRYRYYDSDASKFDGSAYVKASYRISDAWNVFGDLQYRRVNYRTDGYNDKYIDNGDGTGSRHMLDVDVHYDFFNPKAGINYSNGIHRAYASVAVSNREPERNNFTDNGKYPAPRAERLYDFEAGYQIDGRRARAGINLYYMRYRDQLVQTGEISDIGEALTTNIPVSYRTGVELTAGVDLLPWLSLEGNAALSRNRLLDFDEYVEDWDKGVTVIHYDDAALAYSPDAILNGFINVRHKGFRAQWHTGFVSRMYLDNSENTERSLPAYSLSNLSLGYTLRLKGFLKEIDFGVEGNNLFNARVAQSGWVYSALYESGGHPNDHRYYQIGFIPVAGLTVLGHFTLRF
ncbi:MAG: TonB-dependent receptor plug domain-containing protein [Bacteroidales bacterium]|nr:TonB-dependent receptor plug domain-containing protein [Bacteroidales bacterium]